LRINQSSKLDKPVAGLSFPADDDEIVQTSAGETTYYNKIEPHTLSETP
jgi:hypothetical protein